jgi:hypothetical protein
MVFILKTVYYYFTIKQYKEHILYILKECHLLLE